MDVWSEVKEAVVNCAQRAWVQSPLVPIWVIGGGVCVCVCVSVCVTDKEGGHENIVNKDVNDLQLKMSDAMDHSKWRQWLEGTAVTVTVTVTVMLWGEYELHVSRAGSSSLPRLGAVMGVSCCLLLSTQNRSPTECKVKNDLHENLSDAGRAFCYDTVWTTSVNKPLHRVVIATVVNVLPHKYVTWRQQLRQRCVLQPSSAGDTLPVAVNNWNSLCNKSWN